MEQLNKNVNYYKVKPHHGWPWVFLAIDYGYLLPISKADGTRQWTPLSSQLKAMITKNKMLVKWLYNICPRKEWASNIGQLTLVQSELVLNYKREQDMSKLASFYIIFFNFIYSFSPPK